MIQNLVEKYNIKPEGLEQPFMKKLLSCIGSQDSFLVYKNDRSNVL